MRHLKLTKKSGDRMIVHLDVLKQVFLASDGVHSMCVLNVKNRNGVDDVYVLVQETVDRIYEMLGGLTYEFVKEVVDET